MKNKKVSTLFEGKIQPLKDCKPFYMVIVEGGFYPPKVKHEKYEDAFQEMLRISKKENKKAFVMISVSQVELIADVTQFKFKKNEKI